MSVYARACIAYVYESHLSSSFFIFHGKRDVQGVLFFLCVCVCVCARMCVRACV